MNNQINLENPIDEFIKRSYNIDFKFEEEFIPCESSNIDILKIVNIYNEEESKNNYFNAENNESNSSHKIKEGTFDKIQEAAITFVKHEPEGDLKEHEERSHNLETNIEDIEIKLSKSRSGITFEDKLLSKSDMVICWICYRVFNNNYKLNSHLDRVHKYKQMVSKRCLMPKIHKKEDDNNWPPNIQSLAKRVNGIKVFFCNLCTYSVNRSDSMNKHILRVHSKGRIVPQYQCEICGKIFIDKGYLRNHSVSHMKERLHMCSICGLGFHRPASLKRHVQSHSEDKQFSCTLCDYQTNRKHLMYRHSELHRSGRAYSCCLCGTQFITQLSFRSHMYSHNPATNSCSLCKVNFSSRERMLSHMNKVHFDFQIKLSDIKDDGVM